MTDALQHVFAPDRWPSLVYVSARLGGLMLVAPLWSMSQVPGRARAAITLLLSLALLPAAPAVAWPEQALAIPLPLAAELVIGLSVGMAGAVLVQGVALAGEVIALQMGLAIAGALAPVPEAEVPPVGQFHSLLALLVYLALDGHLLLFRALADTLRTLPPGQVFDLAAGGRLQADAAGALFAAAVWAAGPVMVALFVANLAIAVLSRAVPQLNAMLVSFPVTIALGLLVLGAALPGIGAAIEARVQHLPDVLGRLPAFAGAAGAR